MLVESVKQLAVQAPDPSDLAGLAAATRQAVLERYVHVRALTTAIANPLSDEDQCVQAMDDASPIKWHLGHTTWFFETVVLGEHEAGFKPFSEEFLYHFNSYYESLGPRQPRPRRGMITRPSVADVGLYRKRVDDQMASFIVNCPESAWPAALAAIELGLNHEQQHQELMLTDLKYMLYQNPFEAVYVPRPTQAATSGADIASVRQAAHIATESASHSTTTKAAVTTPHSATNNATDFQWLRFEGGIHSVGHSGDGFAYDNEAPRHETLVHPFELANRLVTCGEYLHFIQDGGYTNPAHWLSDGWAKVQAAEWHAPLYWRESTPVQGQEQGQSKGQWQIFTLHGWQDLVADEPVTHVSYYEACAYASWAGARLPREFELEIALEASACESGKVRQSKGFSQSVLHPQPASGQANTLLQGFGEAWQWTCSSYSAYPGFKPFAGAVAEYNGKFMVGQQVLRGGSCVTPVGHSRSTYRNFFPPAAQWQFFGIRLARDV